MSILKPKDIAKAPKKSKKVAAKSAPKKAAPKKVVAKVKNRAKKKTA